MSPNAGPTQLGFTSQSQEKQTTGTRSPSAPKHYSSIPTQVDGAVFSMAHGGGPWDLQKNVTNGSMDILNSGLALGTFLDVEGAFDNVAFSALEKALRRKCESSVVTKWIMDLIRNRSTTVELNGQKRTIRIVKGGTLSPFSLEPSGGQLTILH